MRKPDEILASVSPELRKLLDEFKLSLIRQRYRFYQCGACGVHHQPFQEYCSKDWNEK